MITLVDVVLACHTPLDLTAASTQTILSPPPQNASLAADVDGQIEQQVGGGDAPLSVHRLLVGDGDAHHQSQPPSESDAASVEHAGRSNQTGAFVDGSAICPVNQAGPDLAVPLYRDGTGEEGLTAVDETSSCHDNTLLEDLSVVKVTKVCVNQHKKMS